MENSSKTSSAEPVSSALPYMDVKPVGAADFYTAVNATFRFIERKLGPAGLRRYWLDLGRHYYAPVTQRWLTGGLASVASHWRAFFTAEPGAEVEVHETDQEVVVEVRTCPAIRFLREHGREIVPCFCQHCYHVNTAMGEAAGIEMRLSGGNGRCTQRFAKIGYFPEAQKAEDIATAG
ncbi:hypothetical protein [Prosthecobacter dejongeii]|uniref:L-2-amino-thiazoline-4-carboxylic acid hydrolase n=1 Tax=Prosthecobacter dejongeii TaxID=48465 RepID=A0A7W8DS88_9BACT|nr:hypothetical protein [Prosthecobacter dejongeii]MBB5040232.1 hypothetical protein [Prosthecobacter dejongeii]